MSDLTEALAAYDERRLQPGDSLTITDAARKWADLEAQVADGARVYVEIPCPDERGVEHPGCKHSQACLDSGIDLRECRYSKALDKGINVAEWTEDEPLRVMVSWGRLVPYETGGGRR